MIIHIDSIFTISNTNKQDPYPPTPDPAHPTQTVDAHAETERGRWFDQTEISPQINTRYSTKTRI